MITGFGNNVISSLAADITAGQTTIQVMPGTGAKFAGLLNYDYANASNPLQTYAKITLTDAKETVFEICHLISVNNDVLTVVRGQEGTTAKGWALNDVIANFATRGSENQFVQIEQLQSGHYISGVAGGTANALTLELPATYFVNGSTDWTLRTPIVVYPTQNNTGAATLQLTMGGRVLGTFKLYKGNKAELVANDILKDAGLVCLLDNTKTFFNVMNPGAIYAGLGTAAFHDVQTSQDDVAEGRVLVNGGALALRTVTASTISGDFTDDCNNLPANSVSFVYSSAKNSPGFEASVLDFSGLNGEYRTQIAASYSDGGRRISIRTCNGDNQTWNPWKPIITSDGGTINGDLNLTGILATQAIYTAKLFTNRSEVPFEFGLANQATGPQYWDIHTTYPEIDYDYRVAFNSNVNRIDLLHKTGYAGLNVGGFGARSIQIENIDRRTGNGLIANYDPSGVLAANYGYYQGFFSVNFYNENTGAWISNPVAIKPDGTCLFGAVFDNGQRVYSPHNPQPIDFTGYATQSWVLQNFVQSIDLTAPAEVGFWDGRGYPRATDGAAMYNFNMVGGSSNVGNFIIRYTRRLVNNVWYVLN
ncbi:hypothetical protein ACVTKC_002002 [Citrobacter freundii]|uniref:hypothetical protein n=1 Tax=Citrobacter freundii TaxID=546 RepID=UPI001F235BA7|nr:hypothetical protein [Citrobacter freundii]